MVEANSNYAIRERKPKSKPKERYEKYDEVGEVASLGV